MRPFWLVLVAGCAVGGCAVSTDDETAAESEVANVPDGDDAPPAEPVEPYHQEDPPDPCVTGIPMELAGRIVMVPVPCDKGWIDKGDPPPMD